MNPRDQQRKEEEPQPTTAPKLDDKTPPPTPKDPKKPTALTYKFKFAPADPKNSFDFEDVADK